MYKLSCCYFYHDEICLLQSAVNECYSSAGHHEQKNNKNPRSN